MSEKIVAELKSFAQNKKFCAVYFKSKNGLSDLKFYILQYHPKLEKFIITNRVLADDKFFNHISKEYGMGKNQLLKWIDIHQDKKEQIYLPGDIKIIVTRPF